MLHPEARRAIEQYEGEPKVYEDAFDIADARAKARAAALAEPREDVAEVRDVDAGGVPCRLYRPAGALPGVIVHLHGGGFVFHDVDVHDGICRRMANRGRRAVLSVDYRRPPEAKFPAAPDDLDTVVGWLRREGPPGPYAAHGDSAGANLALVAALRNPGFFRAVALIYPFLDPRAGFGSYEGAAGFDPREAAWYWQQYAATPADLDHPDLAPLLSDRLATLPPTLVVTAEHDPLRDEGEHLVSLLAEAGVTVVGTRYLGQLHGFWRHHRVFPAAEPLMRQVSGFVGGLRDEEQGSPAAGA
jgi:acetyl esterase